MKIEVGMYVRTKYGVARILSTNYTDDIVEDFLIVDKELEPGLISGCDWSLCDKKDVTKASYNIIDLIEVGDYVNGKKVYQVGYNFQDDFVLKMSKSNYENFIYPKDIKSIVTKEQFDQMKYVVE